MSSIPPVSTSVGIDVLKKSEDSQQAAIAQLIAPFDPSQTSSTSTGTDSATFSPAALSQLGLSQTGASLLS